MESLRRTAAVTSFAKLERQVLGLIVEACRLRIHAMLAKEEKLMSGGVDVQI